MRKNIDDPEFQKEMRAKYEGKTLSEIIDIITDLGPSTGTTEEAELLRRWTADALGVVPKSEFIELRTTLMGLELLTKDMEQQLSELQENFGRHRHEFTKKYSEKPSW